MSRTLIPFAVDDVAAFARGLERRLAEHDGLPGHVDMLNMLATAAGFRNFQHFRAQSETAERLARPLPVPVPVDGARLARLVRYFDGEGRLLRWPSKASHRPDCLWVMWSRLPARTEFDEIAIGRALAEHHTFGDHALLRRELADGGLVWRTVDGRRYRRLEKTPPPEARALIRLLAERRAAR